MNVYEDLQRAIQTEWDAATAITPEKVYFAEAPASAAFPRAVFFLDSTDVIVISGEWLEIRVQFNLFSSNSSSEQINDFAEEVRNKFNRKTLTMAGGHTMVGALKIESETTFNNDTNHWQNTMIFNCHIK